MSFALDTFSFLVGFITATVFWWLVGRMKPLGAEIRENWRRNREEAQMRRATGVEENHRRTTLRRAQGMHLAAQLFSLDEIVETPRLLARPPRVDPETPPITEDIVATTVPYMPSWPELAAIYQAPTLDLATVVESGMNIVITGQPGTGKTVALAYLASQISNRKYETDRLSEIIPFFYHITDLHLPEEGNDNILAPILDAVSERAPMLDLTRLPKFVELVFKSKRALFLLDGFDELLPEEQSKISAYLKILLQAYPGNQIITTGCPEYLDGLMKLGFEPMAIMPWKPIQYNQFIEKWGQLWAQTVAAEAWSTATDEETKQSEQIDPLLINSWLNTGSYSLTPLEYTLKVWAGYAGDSLGSDILDFIATHIRRLSPTEVPLAALETLGMQVTLAKQPIFDSRLAREWVKSYEIYEGSVEETSRVETTTLQEPETKMESDNKEKKGLFNKKKDKTEPNLRNGKTGPLGKTEPLPGTSSLLNKLAKSGLLISYSDNRMRFLHPVFEGYLAGRALAEVNADDALLQQPNWIGKLLAMRYIAAHGDASVLANALLKQSSLPLHQHLFVTARWLRDAPRTASWRGKVFAELANLLQTEGIPLALRAQAVAAFCWSGDPGTGPLFRQFLTTHSFELVQMAALGSGAIRDEKAVETLSSVIYAPSAGAQRASVLALVSIGSSSAMEAVARGLLHGDEELRRAAAEALANDPGEGHAMLREGISLADILLRRAVVYGLARLDDDWAIEALQSIQINDDQWVVRNSASEVLESKGSIALRIPKRLTQPSETPWLIEFASKQGVGISPGSPATDVLIAALKSEVEEERLAALPYLKRMPSDGVITNLYHAMYRDDPELREAIFLVLCEFAASGIKLPDPQQFGLA